MNMNSKIRLSGVNVYGGKCGSGPNGITENASVNRTKPIKVPGPTCYSVRDVQRVRSGKSLQSSPFRQTSQVHSASSTNLRARVGPPSGLVRPPIDVLQRVRSSPTLRGPDHNDAPLAERKISVSDIPKLELSKSAINFGCLWSETPRVELTPEIILERSGETKYSRVYDISLRGIHLETIQHLEKFTNVRVLDLSDNHIRVIDNLQNNKELRELKLYGNELTAISNLDRLKELQNLHLQHNHISSIGKGLQCLGKLKVLRLDFNRIDRLTVNQLVSCTQLTSLDVSCNLLTSIAAVNCLPNLEELFARDNKVTAVADLSKCKKLQEVDLSTNPLTDLSGLQGLTSLKVLSVSNCPLRNFSTLKPLSNLEELSASCCGLENLQDVVNLFQKLQILNVSSNQLASLNKLECLKTLSELVELSMSGNPLCSIDEGPRYFALLIRRLLPNLEVLDRVNIAELVSSKKQSSCGTPRCNARGDAPFSARSPTPVLSGAQAALPTARPSTPGFHQMPAALNMSSDEMVQQLTSIKNQLSAFESEFSSKFQTLRASFCVLPSEPPTPTVRTSRPTSRAGIKSRLQEAQMFASQHFENSPS